jgi:hypothetical protein
MFGPKLFVEEVVLKRRDGKESGILFYFILYDFLDK